MGDEDLPLGTLQVSSTLLHLVEVLHLQAWAPVDVALVPVSIHAKAG